MPQDQQGDQETPFIYDVNATDDTSTVGYFVNDTTYFHIDQDGLLTNATVLAPGTYWLAIEAQDQYGNAIEAIISFAVEEITYPWWQTAPENQGANNIADFSYQVIAQDDSGITNYWLNDTSLFEIDGSGRISNTSSLVPGIYWLTVSAINDDEKTTSRTFSINVADAICPWWIEVPHDQTFFYEQRFSYDLNASDDVQINQYWLSDDFYFSIDSNGVLSPKNIVPKGSYTLTVFVNDTSGNAVNKTITITIEEKQSSIAGDEKNASTVITLAVVGGVSAVAAGGYIVKRKSNATTKDMDLHIKALDKEFEDWEEKESTGDGKKE